MIILSPNQTIALLGNKEQFLAANPFLDEEHNELLDEKLKSEQYEDCEPEE